MNTQVKTEGDRYCMLCPMALFVVAEDFDGDPAGVHRTGPTGIEG